jgi:hypothetical protein
LSPAISFGHSNTVFFDDAPIAAAGPVVEISTPILICACAPIESNVKTKPATILRICVMDFLSVKGSTMAEMIPVLDYDSISSTR